MAEIVNKTVDVADHEVPPQCLEQSRTESLLVKYSYKLGTKTEVINPETGDLVCAIEYKTLSRPNLIYTLPNEGSEFAYATLHHVRSRVDIHVRGKPLVVEKHGFLKFKYTYSSPAFQHQTLTWTSKSGRASFDFVCVNEQQMPVARITTSSRPPTKVCNIEFLGSSVDDEAAKEEILVTGLTLTFRWVTHQSSLAATSGSGAAAGAAAAASCAGAAC